MLYKLYFYYGYSHYRHDNAKVIQALKEALTTDRALLFDLVELTYEINLVI
ncbi:hypothetical protein H3S88_11795 [Gilliamella sp. B14448G11]|uniref:hypothetical protein n=1 Tax=unclassified Gilliamella TaxID=2685620 RepID=UPI0018DC9A46|nr:MULTISPECIES: hypothetical protein [unclassified Gilliamella]MBI0029383.1 hypothetical protein [Gilliamella sp. B14448G7]MBI0036342.1 hypothetical protein [Gilliamella sp. B14448G11]MBI0043527.1 hypothetical protein [Gilliamella sp. B14448G12]